MNKFDQTYNSIRKLILEEYYKEPSKYYIDLDIDLLNKQYCDGGISYEDLMWKIKDFQGVNMISLDDQNKSVRLECNDKQLLIDYLRFIDSKKFDYVCSFIKYKGDE